MPVLVEVCLESVQSAVIAEKAGAHRIELCSALDLGGITPSQGLIRSVCEAVSIPVFVLIRPRQGDFIYNSTELSLMNRDIELAIEAGAKGIVSGVLDATGCVDSKATQQLIRASGGLPFTFHRAFDRTNNPMSALSAIIELGADRILTSGQASNVKAGSELIRSLIDKAANQITIMPGGGLTPENVGCILQTGATEIHLSARAPVPGSTSQIVNSVRFNQSIAGENLHYETSETTLKQLFEQINKIQHS
ncbi:MAG TPA: copper homeostasis protein CutC [Bacteroidales bacterium]|nr:copper homeostasis protein CutC [Bacteroidales bacterium]